MKDFSEERYIYIYFIYIYISIYIYYLLSLIYSLISSILLNIYISSFSKLFVRERRLALFGTRAIDDQFGSRRRPRRTETGALMDINSRDSDYHVHAAHTRAPLFANGSRLDAEAGGRYFNERVNRPQFLGFLDSTSPMVGRETGIGVHKAELFFF